MVLSASVPSAVESSLTTTQKKPSMYTSTAPPDLSRHQHALELGLVLAALVLATVAHGGTRLASDFTAAPGVLLRCIRKAERRCV
jgi:hypothetical protein